MLLLLLLLLVVVIVLLLLSRCPLLLLLLMMLLLLLRCFLLIATLSLVSPCTKVLILKVIQIFLNTNTLIVVVAIVSVVAFFFLGPSWIIGNYLCASLTLLLFAELFILVLSSRIELLWTTIICFAHLLSHNLRESAVASTSGHDKCSLRLFVLFHLSLFHQLIDIRALECAFRVGLPLSKVQFLEWITFR